MLIFPRLLLSLRGDRERNHYLPPAQAGAGWFPMVAIPYCYKCHVKVDPLKDRCPKCGSVVRFRFVKPEQEKEIRDAEIKGWERPKGRK